MEKVTISALVCWEGGCTNRDRRKRDKLVGRSSAVLVCTHYSVETGGERRMLSKLTSIIDNLVTPCMRPLVYGAASSVRD